MNAASPPGRGDKSTDEAIRTCHSAGMSQQRTADSLSISRWQVRKASERMDLAWDTGATAEAAEAAAKHARIDRVGLLTRWQEVAHHQLDEFEGAELPDLKRNHLVMAGIATDKAIALARLSITEPDESGMNEVAASFKLLGETIRQSVQAEQAPIDPADSGATLPEQPP